MNRMLLQTFLLPCALLPWLRTVQIVQLEVGSVGNLTCLATTQVSPNFSMAPDQVPPFNAGGVIPPYAGGPLSRSDRSPYDVTMGFLVRTFGTTRDRLRLLRGLVEYRRTLFGGGFLVGYQWIDGSFVEACEVTRGRSPGDIDIATLFHRPLRFQMDRNLWQSEATTIFATHFHRAHCKSNYLCDTFPIDLDKDPAKIVEDVTYWFSLFSHQRVTHIWKGLLRLQLHADGADYANELALVTTAEAALNA